MKRYLFIILFLVTGSLAFAQKENKLYLYGELGFGFNKGLEKKLSLNSVFLKNNIVSGNYYQYSGNANNIPTDYIPDAVLFTIYGDNLPDYNMKTWSLQYGRIFVSESKARLILKVGPTFGTVVHPYAFIPKQSTMTLFGPTTNYVVFYKKESLGGFIINPTIELAFAKWWGMTIGFQGNFNKYMSQYKLEVSTIFGKIRD